MVDENINVAQLGAAQHLLAGVLDAAKQSGYTQAELADAAGIAPETLSRLKRSGDVRVGSLQRLAEAVGLRLALVPDDDLAERVTRRELF